METSLPTLSARVYVNLPEGKFFFWVSITGLTGFPMTPKCVNGLPIEKFWDSETEGPYALAQTLAATENHYIQMWVSPFLGMHDWNIL